MIVQGWIGRGKGWWQSTVHSRVEEFRALREEQLAQMVQPEPCLLHDIRYRHCLEVATIVNLPGATVNDGIIRG